MKALIYTPSHCLEMTFVEFCVKLKTMCFHERMVNLPALSL